MIKKAAAAIAILLILSIGFLYFKNKKQPIETGTVQGTSAADTVVQVDGTELELTQDGVAIKKTQEKNLPTIFLPPETTAAENQKIDDPVVSFALNLTKNLEKSDFSASQIRFVDKVDVIVYSQSEATARFTSQKDVSVQVDSLQSVLSKAKIDASKISQIDLRFNKPVVTYKK